VNHVDFAMVFPGCPRQVLIWRVCFLGFPRQTVIL